MSETPPVGAPALPQLSAAQRRVLGALLEKAFTTPEYYPLTLKALTAACNQKSNRSPVTSYDEEQVESVMDELRALGLAAVVHSELGRTERYRHYMRKQFTLSEPQLAIMTELLLRGRQQLGELRTRASRMAPIESLEQLREELQGLLDLSFIQASGPLERRGVEVDHNWYRSAERHRLEPRFDPEDEPAGREDAADEAPPAPQVRAAGHAPDASTAAPSAHAGGLTSEAAARLAALENGYEQLRLENEALQSEIGEFRDQLQELADRFEQLRTDLGG